MASIKRIWWVLALVCLFVVAASAVTYASSGSSADSPVGGSEHQATIGSSTPNPTETPEATEAPNGHAVETPDAAGSATPGADGEADHQNNCGDQGSAAPSTTAPSCGDDGDVADVDDGAVADVNDASDPGTGSTGGADSSQDHQNDCGNQVTATPTTSAASCNDAGDTSGSGSSSVSRQQLSESE